MRVQRRFFGMAGLVVALTLSACGAQPTGLATGPTQPAASASASTPVNRVPPPPWAWTSVAPHISVATTDHAYVSFMWMDPAYLKFRFVPGYKWPEKSPRTAADKTPASWIAPMVAAFNGAFKLHDGVGGYYYRGTTVAPLMDGQASLVTYADGSLRIGAWNRDIQMSPEIVAVRQNLKPIIDGGVIQATPNDPPKTWGITIHQTPYANRTLLGVMKDGSFVFEFAHRASPMMLAREGLKVGIQFAIVLDMNGIWPTGFVYTPTPRHLIGMKINPYIVRMPKLYMQAPDKDFITVSTPSATAPVVASAPPTYPGAEAYRLKKPAA